MENKTGERLEQFWAFEIDRAEKVRKYFEPHWRTARKAYRNKWYPDFDNGKANVSNAVFYSDVEVQVSNLAANPPVVNVEANNTENEAYVPMIRSIFKYETNRLKIINKIRDLVRDVCITNIGILKVGYNFEKKPGLDADSVFVSRVSPYNYLQDPEAPSMDVARWAGEQRFMTAEELQITDELGKPRYMNVERALETASEYLVNTEMRTDNNTTRSKTAQTDRPSEKFAYDFTSIEPSKIKRIKVYEIYDVENKKILLLVNGNILISARDYSEVPYLVDTPYVDLRFNKVPDFYYAESDFDIHESKLYEIDEISNRIFEYTRRMLPKGVYKKGVVADVEIQKIVRGKMSSLTGVELPPGVSLDDAIKWFQTEPLRQENMWALSYLRESHAQDSGIADFMKGSSQNAKTATEAAMLNQGANSRAALRQKELEDAVDRLYTKMFAVIKHTVDMPRWIAVSGLYPIQEIAPDGTPYVVKQDGQTLMAKQKGFYMTPDLVQSDYTLSIEAGSTTLANSAQKQATIMNLYNLLMQNPLVRKDVLLKKVLQAFNIDAEEIVFTPQEMQAMTPPAAMPPNNQQPPSSAANKANQPQQQPMLNPNQMTDGAANSKLITKTMNQVDSRVIK